MSEGREITAGGFGELDGSSAVGVMVEADAAAMEMMISSKPGHENSRKRPRDDCDDGSSSSSAAQTGDDTDADDRTHDPSSSSSSLVIPSSSEVPISSAIAAAAASSRRKVTPIQKRIVDERRDFDVTIPAWGKKSLAIGVWSPQHRAVQMLQLKGNFWRVHGYHSQGKDFLHAEEALMLVEKGSLIVQSRDEDVAIIGNSSISISSSNSNIDVSAGVKSTEKIHKEEIDNRMPLKKLYELVVSEISLPCYLVYTKLKNMEYLVFRPNCHRPPRCVRSQSEVADIARSLPSSASLLEALCSFNVYLRTSNWSKKLLTDVIPLNRVIITSGENMFSPQVLLRLLDESRGVSILVAVVLPSFGVILHEFSDGLSSFNWNNDLAFEDPTDFTGTISVLEMMKGRTRSTVKVATTAAQAASVASEST